MIIPALGAVPRPLFPKGQLSVLVDARGRRTLIGISNYRYEPNEVELELPAGSTACLDVADEARVRLRAKRRFTPGLGSGTAIRGFAHHACERHARERYASKQWGIAVA